MILIDNTLQVAKIRLGYIISFLMSMTFYTFSMTDFLDNKLSLVFAIISTLLFIYLVIIKPEYFFVQIKNNKNLIIRTYHAFPLFRKYKVFEIPLNSFVGVETKKNVFSSKGFVRFLVRTKASVGKYPWISLSIVPKKDYNRFVTYVNKTLKKVEKLKAL